MSPPTRIGRYEVLARLATGGMAEVFLCRLWGAEGFQRNVVIKRMLPHFARDPDFRAMFIDEARIVARLSHPNVVLVHELIEEEDELFLVMEYLAGETLSALNRAIIRAEQQFPPLLAAYILAETAAGLHAAHELTDQEGNSFNVVHRDVSPQNIFVGYDGSVKIIDFGVAKASNRMSTTTAGTIKGKFGYMSPEQLKADDDLDRRADVFSCGAVLYELLSQRRAFEGNHVAIANAIVNPESAPRVDTIVDGMDAGIADVVEKALARDRDDRYESALALRADLLEVMRGLSAKRDPATPSVPEEQLARLMDSHFAASEAKKKKLLASVRPPGPAPSVEASADPGPTVASRRPRRPWKIPVLVAGVLLGGVAVGALAVTALSDDTDPAPSIASPTSVEAQAPEPEPEPEPVGVEPEPVDPPAETSARSVLRSTPNASVFIDDEEVGETPYTYEGTAGTQVSVELRRSGYTRTRFEFVVGEEVETQTLARVRRPTMRTTMQTATNTSMDTAMTTMSTREFGRVN